jgi:transcriptional regulator with XRE-family HTH domain
MLAPIVRPCVPGFHPRHSNGYAGDGLSVPNHVHSDWPSGANLEVMEGRVLVQSATIGSALRNRRRELGVDQQSAAAHIGMSRTTFSSYERDLQRPSAEVLPPLARFLDVTIDEILVLYGATCIETIRPQLERLVPLPHGGSAVETAVEGIGESDGSDAVDSPSTGVPSVSIFAHELSDSARISSVDQEPTIAAPAKASPAAQPRNDASDVLDSGRKKKKKKKKKR